MQETNKLSIDDTYLVVRDNGGQALVHTDTFAEQKGFAKLATDAARKTNAAKSIAAWHGINVVTVAGRQK